MSGKRRKSSCLRERRIHSSGLGVIGKATSLLTRRTVKANALKENKKKSDDHRHPLEILFIFLKLNIMSPNAEFLFII